MPSLWNVAGEGPFQLFYGVSGSLGWAHHQGTAHDHGVHGNKGSSEFAAHVGPSEAFTSSAGEATSSRISNIRAKLGCTRNPRLRHSVTHYCSTVPVPPGQFCCGTGLHSRGNSQQHGVRLQPPGVTIHPCLGLWERGLTLKTSRVCPRC